MSFFDDSWGRKGLLKGSALLYRIGWKWGWNLNWEKEKGGQDYLLTACSCCGVPKGVRTPVAGVRVPSHARDNPTPPNTFS